MCFETGWNVFSWLRSEVPDVPIEICSSPSMRHSPVDVGIRTDFVCLSLRPGPSWRCRRRTEPDPERTFVMDLLGPHPAGMMRDGNRRTACRPQTYLHISCG